MSLTTFAPPSTGGPTELSEGSRTALVILSIVAALLIVAAITLAFVWRHNETSRSSLDDARAAAVSAARQEIINLDSISAATIDADLTRTVAGATGSFKDLFTKSQADLKQLVLQRKTVSTATIRSAGVVRADTDTATVLVAVDRTLKDSTSKDGVIQHDRWKLDLELHGGRWLVANLVPVA